MLVILNIYGLSILRYIALGKDSGPRPANLVRLALSGQIKKFVIRTCH